ncbi:DUF455 family protein [Paenibacillus piri]|uniref:DUF455 family protein n=1 Tax=Paenibacillus piri TaxID=2547395 RepID=A0A4R5KJ82_9BACL|nr:DUF455 family protein [Paenibacillus piri]TDF94855.1 DUF455 family protein [Paenibacillus piri]
MKENVREYVEERLQGGVDISKSVELLRRYAYIEQSCVRALAGWFLKIPDWEMKIELGYHLYAHAERLNELGTRLEELRGGRHRDANIEPALARVGEELIQAPDERSFLSGLAWMLRNLADVYREHAEAGDSSANALEIRILYRLLSDVERELESVKKLLLLQSSPSEEENRWTTYLQELLQEAGCIGGLGTRIGRKALRPEKALFEWPAHMIFDDRIQHDDLGSYESKLSLPLRERSIGEFQVYFNEFYAAALLATIIFDSWKLDAPRQYFMDIAHHFWDEVRHAQFGAIRLRELGVEPSKVNMVLFEQSQGMPLLHRLCYLTLGLEVYFMPRKSVRVRYYEQQGDPRSQLFADVDWSDESNHVRYGKHWVDYLLKDDARSIEDVQEEITKYMETYANNLPDGQKVPW